MTIILLKDREDQLFDRWRTERGYTSFMADGVPNEAVWDRQKWKITFVLKEANWLGGNEDLREFLLAGGNWKTWNNIARWTKALLEGGEYPQYVSKADRIDWLSRVSFMNLKKVPGGPHTVNRELRDFAEKNAGFLREQLSLYAPDIVICCGWWVAADIMYQNVLPKELLGEWMKTEDGFDYFYGRIAGKSTPVVSFYHPQRVAGHAVFRGWYESMRKIGNELLK